MIVYKVNLIKELKKLGLDYAAMKKNKIISQCTMRKFAKEDVYISVKTLNKLCCILGKQPEDTIYLLLDFLEGLGNLPKLKRGLGVPQQAIRITNRKLA